MKTIRQYIKMVIIFLMASACATVPATIPEKYNLDNQLENVPNISGFSLMSWEKVDNQSFILQTSPNDYYLIILDSKSDALPFTRTIQITNTDSLFWPGYSNVIGNDDGWEDSYIINKIYRFKNCNQVDLIREELSR